MTSFVLSIEGQQPITGDLQLEPVTEPIQNPALFDRSAFATWQDRILDAHLQMRRVRKWGDPVLVEQADASVDLVGTTNFQAVGLYNKDTGFGGVTNFLRISHGDMMKVSEMQVEDEYQSKIAAWLDQKMRWLYKARGTIYMAEHVDKAMTWDTAPSIRWGTISLGGNLVQVETYEMIKCKLPAATSAAPHLMARLKGFRKADWGRPFADLLAEGLVHRCFCAYSGNSFGDSPKGIVYSPLFSPLDWDFAGNAQPTSLYIPAAWLE